MPKEMVFVLDTSGSMQGSPLDTAKKTMDLALDLVVVVELRGRVGAPRVPMPYLRESFSMNSRSPVL